MDGEIKYWIYEVDDSAQDPHINEFLFPFEDHFFSFRDLVRDFNQLELLINLCTVETACEIRL